jgi:hypothetical protein
MIKKDINIERIEEVFLYSHSLVVYTIKNIIKPKFLKLFRFSAPLINKHINANICKYFIIKNINFQVKSFDFIIISSKFFFKISF